MVSLNENKLILNEDSRLGIMAYLIVQSACAKEVLMKFKAVENFVNFELYEEAAPISTVETAFQIIMLEFSEAIILTNQSQRGKKSSDMHQQRES